ncbi:RNA polymerase II [Mactra antiquata]
MAASTEKSVGASSKIFAACDMKITKLKTRKGQKVSKGSLLCFYKDDNDVLQRFKSNEVGTITEIFAKDGDIVSSGTVLFICDGCKHPTVMKDMCADCGADLRVENSTAGNRKEQVSASVAMIHSIPELIVSEQLAKELGKADEDRLLKTRKLVLLVDLDQTLIHTTNDTIPANLKDVHHYQLWHGNQLLWYHTRLRPQTQTFLENISKLYELHICTFGSRIYAHTIAKIIDPEGKYFSHRILSRDECFNAQAKTANLKALFPNGDSMVCIIDDREDVWHYSPNLVHVKPYRFFQGTADINAPPGLTKTEQDNEPVVHRVRKVSVSSTNSNDEKVSVSSTNSNDEKGKNKADTESGNGDCKEKANGDAKDNVVENNDEKVSGDNDNKTVETDKTKSDNELKNKMECSSNDDKALIVGASTEVDAHDGKSDKVVDDQDNKSENDKQDSKSDDKQESNIEKQENKGEQGKQESNDESQESKNDKQDDKNEDNQNSKNDDKQDSKSKNDDGNDKQGSMTDKNDDNVKSTDNDQTEEELIEWEDEDDYLLHLEEILKNIHSTFYHFHDQFEKSTADCKDKSNDDFANKPSLKNLIPYIKRKVLKDCNLVFSGVIPTNMAPEKSRGHMVARSLGANIHTEFKTKENEKDPNKFTTHLVAARLGTQKVRTAMRFKHVNKVNADWLWSCSERWERVEEMLFPLSVLSEEDQGRDSPDITQQQKHSNKRKRQSDDNSDKSKRSKGPKDDEVDKIGEVGKPDNFSLSYNPLLAFSDDDLAYMDKEVDDELDNDEDANPSSEDDDSRDCRIRNKVLKTSSDDLDISSSSSDESMCGDLPRGWGLRKKISPKSSSEDEASKSPLHDEIGPEYESETDQDKFDKIMDAFGPETENSDEEYAESVGSIDEEIAEAVMKEFLS